VSHYGKSKAFLKVKGRPVIFVYGRVMGQVRTASWPAIVKAAHAGAGNSCSSPTVTPRAMRRSSTACTSTTTVCGEGQEPRGAAGMGGRPICECGEPGPQAQPDQLCHGHSGLR